MNKSNLKMKYVYTIVAIIVLGIAAFLFFKPNSTSTNPNDGVLSATSSFGFPSTVPTFHYHDEDRLYGFDIPLSFTLGKSSVASFAAERAFTAIAPIEYFSSKPSTVDRAELYVRNTTFTCSMVDKGNSFGTSTASVATRQGDTLQYYAVSNAGAGNIYNTYEYTILRKDGTCARIGLFLHMANPGVVYESKGDIDRADANNAKIIASLLDVLKKAASSYRTGTSAEKIKGDIVVPIEQLGSTLDKLNASNTAAQGSTSTLKK